MRTFCFLLMAVFAVPAWSIEADAVPTDVQVVAPENDPAKESVSEESPNEDEPEQPWDFSPYRVLIWIASDNSRVNAASVGTDLREFLDRDFASIWRVDIQDAPVAVRSAAFRDIDAMDYDRLTAADPVLAVKRDHKDAIRIRSALTVAEYVGSIAATRASIDELVTRGEAVGNGTVNGVSEKLTALENGSPAMQDLWRQPGTEAVLVSRGMALTLDEPEAKLVTPPIAGLVSETVENYDKVFIVRIETDSVPAAVSVVELDTLMRFFGPVARQDVAVDQRYGDAIGHTTIKAFAPVVRIDDAGQKNATGLIRAGGLILDETSPAMIRVSDVLQPMTRKNDRNGDPFLIGPIDWAYLITTEVEGRTAKMDFYAGRSGGLQGRKNNRTFRTALKVRMFEETTMLRLHAQGDVNFPLIGYEIYEKELKSTSMTFIGRTDWNGRLLVGLTDDPLRLMYVKNGGSVLARLPMVPGLYSNVVADLQGDDLRLQAEAYIRGVQNAIIDLVAVRELYKARIRMRLQSGEMDKAEELMEALRNQPSNEKLAGEMGKKQAVYLKLLGNRNSTQKRMVDEMFTSTRELLSKHINPLLVRELEGDMIKAKRNGGKLPPENPAKEDGE